jgi:hypothetical protein
MGAMKRFRDEASQQADADADGNLFLARHRAQQGMLQLEGLLSLARCLPFSRRRPIDPDNGCDETDGGRARNVAEQRHLAERLAGMQDCQPRLDGAAPVGDVHAHGAARDDVEGVALISLAEDDRGRRVGERVQVCRKLGQHDSIQSPEEVDPAQQARVFAVVPRPRVLLLGPLSHGLPLAAIRLRMIRRHGHSPLRCTGVASKTSDTEAMRDLMAALRSRCGHESREGTMPIRGVGMSLG